MISFESLHLESGWINLILNVKSLLILSVISDRKWRVYVCFGLLVGQKNQSKDISLGSEIVINISHSFLTFIDK